MAIIWQESTATREFACEFKQCSRDVGMAKEDTKVQLVYTVNQDTQSHLDAYITMRGGDKMAHLETIQKRLC